MPQAAGVASRNARMRRAGVQWKSAPSISVNRLMLLKSSVFNASASDVARALT